MRIRFLIFAIIAFGIGFAVTAEWDRSHRLHYERIDLKWNRKYLSAIAKHLREYRKVHGRYPTNDEGLRVVQIDSNKPFGVDHYLWRFVTSEGDVCSIWGEPIIYENRRGLTAEKFRDSGATIDTKRVYSVEVDKDIYIWSLGAPQVIAAYRRNTLILRLLQILFFGGACLFVCLWIRSGYNPSRRIIHRLSDGIFYGFTGGLLTLVLGSFLAMLTSTFIGGALATSCYECYFPTSANIRSPELTDQYIELTKKYRDRGIISETTYQKILSSMKQRDKE